MVNPVLSISWICSLLVKRISVSVASVVQHMTLPEAKPVTAETYCQDRS
jgi:hypothetical protein